MSKPKPAAKRPSFLKSWSYRVIRHREGVYGDTFYFEIHECHYDKKTDAIPTSWAAEPSHPGGETLDELKQDWMMMARAMLLPVLEIVDGKLREVAP